MRHHPAWFLVTALLLTTAAPLRASGPLPCRDTVSEGTWTRWLAPVAADWGNGQYRNMATANDDAAYGVTVDPWHPCQAYRIGTPDQTFANRSVVQRTTDRGVHWRTIRTVDGARYNRVYVPAADEVDLAEDDGTTAILRSTDRGDHWSSGGLDGHHVYALAFGPAGAAPAARHEYAVTLPCREDLGSDVTGTGCQRSPVLSLHFIGKVGFWHKAPGGTWTQVTTVPSPDSARSQFAVRVDPDGPAMPYVYDRPYGSVTGPAAFLRGLALEQRTTTTQTDDQHFQVCRRHGALVMLANSFEADQMSSGWPPAFRDVTNLRSVGHTPTVFGPGPACPLFQLRFTATGAGNSIGHDARATWSPSDWNGETDVELGRFPSALADHGPGALGRLDGLPIWLPPDNAYEYAVPQVGAGGTYYVTVGRQCHSPATTHEGDAQRPQCGGGNDGPGVYEWVTWAYRVPADRTRSRTVRSDAGPGPATCAATAACALTAGPSCTLAEGAEPGTGLAFDGRDLLTPTDAGRRFAVRFARVDPGTCKEVRPRLTITVPADQLREARRLTTQYQGDRAGRPALDSAYADADTVTYDAARGDLYFSLRDNATGSSGITIEGNPASVWVSHDLRTATLLYVGDRCLDDPGNQSGMDLLSWDGDSQSLLACADARPLPITRTGRTLTPYCLTTDTYRGNGVGWAISSWTDAEDGRALVLVDNSNGANVVTYRSRDCAADGAFGASGIFTAKGGVGGHAQLSCTPPGAATDETLLWFRRGGALKAYGVPGAAHWCRVPTHLDVSTGPALTCATLTAVGPRTPSAMQVAGRRVDVRLDDVTVAAPPTGKDGKTCVARSARRDARASFAADYRFLASNGTWPPVVLPKLPPKVVIPSPPVVPPRPPQPEPPVVRVPPAPAPVPAVQVPGPPPPGANAAGLSETREEQQQLAYVGQDVTEQSDPDPSTVEELAAAALIMAAATVVAWRRRAAHTTAPQRRY